MRAFFFYHPEKSVEKFFGVWLRAPSRCHQNHIGERWLHLSFRWSPSSGDQVERRMDLVFTQPPKFAHYYGQSAMKSDVTGAKDGRFTWQRDSFSRNPTWIIHKHMISPGPRSTLSGQPTNSWRNFGLQVNPKARFCFPHGSQNYT